MTDRVRIFPEFTVWEHVEMLVLGAVVLSGGGAAVLALAALVDGHAGTVADTLLPVAVFGFLLMACHATGLAVMWGMGELDDV